VSALSDKDRNDIKLAAEIGADFLAVSFVRSADDMHQARRLLHEAGGNAALVAKIERADAIPVLGEIIDASDVVMVARGDLGVEIGDAELPGLQKKIIRESVQRNRAVITATQMLQSMVRSPIPDPCRSARRGQRGDRRHRRRDAVGRNRRRCASGQGRGGHAPHLPRCRAPVRAEGRPDHRRPSLDRTDQAIALAAMLLASELGVRAIVALTESGATAQWLSRYRSAVPIYALSPLWPMRAAAC
jgi:pyruvate kinase